MPPLFATPGKILIRSTNWIGDALMTTPAVRTIRSNFPEAEITLLALPWVADVFRASPHINRIFLYEKNGRHQGLRGKLRLAGELKTEGFEAVILLQNAFEAALISLLAGIPVRAGYNSDGRALLLTHPVRRTAAIRRKHQVYYYQEMLAGLGLRPGSPRLELFLQPEARDNAGRGVARFQNGHRAPLIGLNPGAAYGPAKRWPVDKFARLARRLCEQGRNRVVVFGTAADSRAAAEIKQAVGLGERVLDLTGRTDLATAMAYIDRCDAFVTNDSGLMHVAAALDTPTVAIFGSTDHIATGPWSGRARIIRKPVSCSPCMKTHCPRKEADKHLLCLEQIRTEEVAAMVGSLLWQCPPGH